jgi:hypothetical protein
MGAHKRQKYQNCPFTYIQIMVDQLHLNEAVKK